MEHSLDVFAGTARLYVELSGVQVGGKLPSRSPCPVGGLKSDVLQHRGIPSTGGAETTGVEFTPRTCICHFNRGALNSTVAGHLRAPDDEERAT